MIRAREPRDRTPESDEGICFLCGKRAYNGDRVQDQDGRDYHQGCLITYYAAHLREHAGS